MLIGTPVRLKKFPEMIQYQAYAFKQRMLLNIFNMARTYPSKIRLYSGLTLIELLIVVVILAILLSMAIPSYNRTLNKAEVAKAIGDIKFLEKKIFIYSIEHGKLPDSLADLGYGNMLDPWGHPYCYLNFANVTGKGKMRKDRFLVPLNSDYDLYSMGKDGKTTTPVNAIISHDDIIRANDGGFIGLGKDY